MSPSAIFTVECTRRVFFSLYVLPGASYQFHFVTLVLPEWQHLWCISETKPWWKCCWAWQAPLLGFTLKVYRTQMIPVQLVSCVRRCWNLANREMKRNSWKLKRQKNWRLLIIRYYINFIDEHDSGSQREELHMQGLTITTACPPRALRSFFQC